MEFGLTAEVGASATFENLGANTFHASCDNGDYKYDLLPNTPTTIANPKSTKWTPTCEVSATDKEDRTSVTGTANSSLNVNMNSQPMCMDLVQGFELGIVANMGSAVKLDNQGSADIIINCKI